MSKSSDAQSTPEITEDFVKVIYDLINDILVTFPEFNEGLNLDLHNIKETRDEESVQSVYDHIKKVYPERFFDILYKNEDIFTKPEINTEFLPGIDFKDLWKTDISDTTKDTIWKYLQIILFSVIGKVNSQDSFGATAKLFEAINEDELKQKLEETMENLQNMMGSSNDSVETNESTDSNSPVIDISGINLDQLPKPDDIQGHINGLLDGKLGNLAKEIAAETAEELNIDAENATSVNEVFQNLFKNPGKLMSLVQNVGGKLDSKIKSGEIKESELIQEAGELLGKMKDMPGMGDIQSLMKKMGMGGIPGMGQSGGDGSGMPDMSALQGMMKGMGGLFGGKGGGGMPDMSALQGMMGAMGGLGAMGGGQGGGMPDMSALQGMMGAIGGGPGQGTGNLDINAMNNALTQNVKRAEMKERALKNSAQKKLAIEHQRQYMESLPEVQPLTEAELEQLVFSIEGDKPEKTMRNENVSKTDKPKKKKKKGKK